MQWDRLSNGAWVVAGPVFNSCRTDWNVYVTKYRMLRLAAYPLILFFLVMFIEDHPHLEMDFLFMIFCVFLVIMEIYFYFRLGE